MSVAGHAGGHGRNVLRQLEDIRVEQEAIMKRKIEIIDELKEGGCSLGCLRDNYDTLVAVGPGGIMPFLGFIDPFVEAWRQAFVKKLGMIIDEDDARKYELSWELKLLAARYVELDKKLRELSKPDGTE